MISEFGFLKVHDDHHLNHFDQRKSRKIARKGIVKRFLNENESLFLKDK